jgi:hypothetical protein
MLLITVRITTPRLMKSRMVSQTSIKRTTRVSRLRSMSKSLRPSEHSASFVLTPTRHGPQPPRRGAPSR